MRRLVFAPVARLFQPATKSTTPRVRVLATPGAQPTLPTGFETLRTTIDSIAGMMTDSPPTAQSFRDRLLIASSSSLSESQRRAYVAGLRAAVQQERDKFQLPKGGSITLTARTGAIPVTVRSSAEYPARVVLQIASDRLKFPDGSTMTSKSLKLARPSDVVLTVVTGCPKRRSSV